MNYYYRLVLRLLTPLIPLFIANSLYHYIYGNRYEELVHFIALLAGICYGIYAVVVILKWRKLK